MRACIRLLRIISKRTAYVGSELRFLGSVRCTLPPLLGFCPFQIEANSALKVLYIERGEYFTLDIEGNEILIESIQVYTTDTRIGFRFFLFPARPPDSIEEWDNDDLIRAGMAKQRVYTFYREKPPYYRDYEGSNKLHAGLHVGQRPLRFDLITEKQKKAYYTAPVSYKIRLKYKPK